MEKVLNSGNSRTRDFQFDIARCIAVIYVVGYFHLVPGYMDEGIIRMITGKYTYVIINSVLGLFMFISGYFLTNYRFETYADMKAFYIKRLKRFYPLYFLALLSMFFGGWIQSLKILITSAVGLSSIITPQPGTLWFFSMLVLFYILTPLLMLHNDHSNRCWKFRIKPILKMGGALLSFLLMDKVFNIQIDQKIYWCFTCYSLGLLTGSTPLIKNVTSRPFYFVCFLLVFCLTIDKQDRDSLFCIINIVTGILSILSFSYFLSSLINNNKSFSRLIGFISYASMCAYLFHRHVYKLGRMSCEDGIIPFWYGVLILLPLVFIVSYFIQKAYDIFISWTALKKM